MAATLFVEDAHAFQGARTLQSFIDHLYSKEALCDPPIEPGNRKSAQRASAYKRFHFLLQVEGTRSTLLQNTFEAFSDVYAGYSEREVIPFCSKRSEFGVFSNWHPTSFTWTPNEYLREQMKVPMVSLEYKTAEQAIMAYKAALLGDECSLELITEAYQKPLSELPEDSYEAYIKRLGRETAPGTWDEDLWQHIVLVLAVDILAHKFDQSDDSKSILLSTGNAIIVEGADYDPLWGVLLDEKDSACKNLACWCGWNILGEALMIVRRWLASSKRSSLWVGKPSFAFPSQLLSES